MNPLYIILVLKTLFWVFVKRSKGSLAAVCLFFLGSIIPAQAVVWNKDVTEAEVLEMARPMTSVVNIKILGGNGSGVLLPSGKHVLTAKHVVLNPIFDIFGYEQPSARVYVTMEDAAGRKTETMAKGVYFHPSAADIAIIELSDPVAKMLDEDGNCPAITPSALSRDDPRDLCGERLYGAGYGRYGMELDEESLDSSGDRRYYETFFNFVLDLNCLPCVSDDPSHLDATIEDIIKRMEDLERCINEGLENRNALRLLTEYQEALSNLLNKSFEVRVDERMRNKATFIGTALSGDSGSPLFDEEGQVIAVITDSTVREGGLLEHSTMGELVYLFLDWIDDVIEGRKVDMVTFGSLDVTVELALDLAVDLTVKVLYGLDYATAAASPVISSLYNVLAYTCAMDNDNTCFAGLITKAVYEHQLFSLLNEGSYLGFSQLLVVGYFLEGFISWGASHEVTAP